MAQTCFLCKKKLGYIDDRFGELEISYSNIPIPERFGEEDVICYKCLQIKKIEREKGVEGEEREQIKKMGFDFVGKTIETIWFKEMEKRQVFLENEKIIAAIKGTIESGIRPLSGDRSTFSNIGLLGAVATNARDGLIGLTNKRIIFYMPKILDRYEFESYDLDQISSIQFSKGLHWGRIQITAFNDHKTIKWVDNEEGKTITTMIQKAVHDLKFAKTGKPQKESGDDDVLKILKLRLAKGEITKEEFEDLKSTLK